MKKEMLSVWSLTILCLVLGCQEELKISNTEALPEQKQLKNTVPTPVFHETMPKADIYVQAAIETCHCIQPMVEKAKYLKELENNKQKDDMKKVAREMAEIQPQVQKCSDEIRKKYNKINNAIDEQRILNALTTECPDMATLFSNLTKVVQK